jgi:hypothetical protein
MAVSRVDVIVHCAKVGGSSDEVDVVVGVIVLLELNDIKPVSSQGRWSRQLLDQIWKLVLVYN